MNPEVHERIEDGGSMPFLVWRLSSPRLMVSSGALGGGIGLRSWVLNAQVARGYDRDDPAGHLAQLAADAGLVGDGVGLMTAVDVRTVASADEGGVATWATVGVDRPSWAAAPDQIEWREPVGTINVVVTLPVRLADGALVNAVATATEAKAQALRDHRLAGTGTPTDAVCVVCPPDGPVEAYGGPRSRWGAPLARTVHRAVLTGLRP